MEKVIEENTAIHFENNKQAANRNAVELKQTFKFPSETLALLSDADKKPAKVI